MIKAKETENATLIQKLLLIQSELKAPKSQYNKFGEFYYRSCEDILSAAKPLCVREGVLLNISDEVVLIGERYYVKATASITDGQDTISVSAYARETESRPKMDAAQLTGSASSYARKYGLNGLFCLDDTKDADAMKPVENQPNKDKTSSKKDGYLRMIAAEAKKQHLNANEIKDIMNLKFGKDSSSKLTEEEAEEFANNFVTYALEYIDSKMMEGVA